MPRNKRWRVMASVPCADKYDPMIECVYRNAVLNGERGKYVSE